ncbi:MAG: M1 family aminopeptidase [Candidatus Heimdallarchaeota archaeon]
MINHGRSPNPNLHPISSNQERVGISRYRMDVELDTLRTHSLSCHYSLEYTNTENVPLTELFFHLYPNAFQDVSGLYPNASQDEGGALMINSVTDKEGNLFMTELLNQTNLRLVLAKPLQPWDSLEIRMEFDVKIPHIPNRFGYWENDNMTTLNLGNWYPIVAVFEEIGWHTKPYAYSGESFYSDIADYQVNITVPTGEVVAATGVLINRVPGENGTTTWCWEAELVRDFVFSVSPDFQVRSKQAQGTTISSYYVAIDSERGERALEIAETSLKLFSQLYGPYPYTTFSIVENPTPNGGGMEYPTFVLMGSGLYRRASAITFEAVLVHEIAHQWFPFLIGSNSFAEPFADEAFATFSEKLYWEFVYGPEAEEAAWQYSQNHYFSFLKRTGVDEIVYQNMSYWDRSAAYSPIVYSKGALIIRMLRFVVGNTTFFRAMQTYYERFLHTNAKIRDLITVFEEVSGTDLDWFFMEWLFRKGLPKYELESAEVEQVGTEYELTISVHQQTCCNETHRFQMPVPFLIQYEQHLETRTAWVNFTKQEIRFTTGDKPVLVELDRQKVILRINIDQTLSKEVKEPKRLQEILLGLPTVLIGAALIGLGSVLLLRKWRRTNPKSPGE